MLTTLGEAILSNTQWLYVKVHDGRLVFFDLWTFVHAWSGFMLFLAATALGLRRAWTWLFAGLLAYELVELLFIYVAFHAFRPETLKDQLTDIVVGLGGGLAARFIATGPFARRAGPPLAAGLAAATLAFLWVGHYGYAYSLPMLNSAGLNWWAWSCWSVGLVALLQLQARLALALRSGRLFWAATYALYLPGLLAVEFTGYRLLGIQEVGHAQRLPLVADLIHGSFGLHLAYLAAPVAAWFAHRALLALLRQARIGAAARLLPHPPSAPTCAHLTSCVASPPGSGPGSLPP